MSIEQQLQEDDQSKIQVQVLDPQVKDGGMQKYILYTIKGEDSKGNFEIQRRFSDFDMFRKTLLQRWPSCFIPPIPPKKVVGNMDNAFIEDRRLNLEQFLIRLSQLQYLWYNEETQIFIREKSELDKILGKLEQQTNQQIIEKYQENFKQLSGKEINSSIESKIDNFNVYLKKINAMLENYKQMAKNAVKSREKDNESVQSCITYLLPEYENHCLQEYVGVLQEGKMIFQQNQDEKQNQMVAQFKEFLQNNQLYKLYELIKQEQRDVMAFIECMDSRQQYIQTKNKLESKQKDMKLDQQKIMAGKSTLKNIFTKKLKKRISNIYKFKLIKMKQNQSQQDLLQIYLQYFQGMQKLISLKRKKNKFIIKLQNKSQTMKWNLTNLKFNFGSICCRIIIQLIFDMVFFLYYFLFIFYFFNIYFIYYLNFIQYYKYLVQYYIK
ncbi:PX domain protein, partial [Ichthyophthirius multifiliis]